MPRRCLMQCVRRVVFATPSNKRDDSFCRSFYSVVVLCVSQTSGLQLAFSRLPAFAVVPFMLGSPHPGMPTPLHSMLGRDRHTHARKSLHHPTCRPTRHPVQLHTAPAFAARTADIAPKSKETPPDTPHCGTFLPNAHNFRLIVPLPPAPSPPPPPTRKIRTSVEPSTHG